MFNCLQNVDTGRIGCSELRRYAVLSGFEGDADEWAEEYEDLCADQGWSKDTGISRLEFAGLMKDEQMGSDEELKAILMELRMSPKKRRTFDQMSQLAGKTASRNRVDVTELDRSALVAEAFRCLDVRRKELLTSREFRRYAELTGYDEGEEFWEEQYEELCQEYGWTPEVGVGLREFEDFIGDETNSSDEELRDLVLALQFRQDVAARRLRSAVSRIIWMLRYAGMSRPKGKLSRQEIDNMSRKQMIDAIFEALDRKRRQRLDSKYLRLFANATGFCGDDEDWTLEYRSMCADAGWDADRGLSLQEFHEFLKDEESTSSEELRIMLFNLPSRESLLVAPKAADHLGREDVLRALFAAGAPSFDSLAKLLRIPEVHGTVTFEEFKDLVGSEAQNSTAILRHALMQLRRTSRRVSVQSQVLPGHTWSRRLGDEDLAKMSRQELIDAGFALLDSQHRQELDAGAIRTFAEQTGFEGSSEDWEEQFAAMCGHFGWEQGQGVSKTQFAELVEDDEDMDDDELRHVVSQLSRRRASRVSVSAPWQRRSLQLTQVDKMGRSELVNSLFTMLDEHRKSRLGSSELHAFAERTGFDGEEEEWTSQFQAMAETFGWEDGLVSRSQFAEFLGDDEEHSDDELRRVLLSLQLQQRRTSKRASATSWSRRSFVQPDASTMTRRSLVDAIFHCLDPENNQTLDAAAIRTYAEETGFEGSDEDWAQQFEAMRSHFGWSQTGISSRQFLEFVEEEDDTDDEELREVLEHLRARQRRSRRSSSAVSRSSVKSWGRRSFADADMSRPSLIGAIFRKLDAGQGLNSHELLRFARLSGFTGDDEEWAEQFEAICESYSWSNSAAISRSDFFDFVGDEEENSTAELREVFKSLQQGEDDLRESLVKRIFAVLADSSKLRGEGLERFARLRAFDGSKAQWQEEFQAMCQHFNWNPAAGISLVQFQDFLSDEDENTDAELRDILAKLQTPVSVSQPRSSGSGSEWRRRSFVVKLQEEELRSLGREELIDAIFSQLDKKKEQILGESELETYARLTGFSGSEEDWRQQYAEMCSHYGWDDSGTSREQFYELVGDPDETSQEELTTMLLELRT
ncbi:unnamed protein product [Effrenium voratum]|uniref:Calmodulin n=1 Tax=Effrenium voratum TaxID=2562239 RepID=A0AA36IW95_9DINO|nr:unnamed protein product [Effrenium voratum]